MKNASKLNSNLSPLSLPLEGGEGMNCEYLSPKGGETTPSINLPLSGREATSSINLPLSGREQKRGLYDYNYKSAFTLVELAIVIVVLGILIGGVLTGQSIIESARISEAVTKVNQMSTALRAFNLEFDALPGDMKDAYQYWGDECGLNSTSDAQGCNGGGDKCIDRGACPPVSYDLHVDIRRAPIHLNLSGIMPDINFITNSNPSDQSCTNVAPEIMGDATYAIYSPRVNKVNLQISSQLNFVTSRCLFPLNNPVLTPKQAKTIDEKLDNGNGRTGKIKAYNNFSATNESLEGTDCMDADGVYNVGNSDKACNLRVEDIY
jgi:prepilin-type N-terminal cleavage/methylation domain-containing protein